MKIFLVSLVSFFSFVSHAEETAKIHYFENYPGNKQKLVFKMDKSCKSDPSALQIRDFFSEKKYTSADTGKQEPVRIVHVHVNSSLAHCKNVVAVSSEKTFEIPKTKMMTHVYIIADPAVQVNSFQ